MSSVRSWTCGLLLLALCASGARIKKSAKLISEVDDEIAAQAAAVVASPKDDIDSEIAKLDADDYDNWSDHDNNNTKLGLIDHQHTQQFEIKEDFHMFKMKEYKAYLDQWEDENHIEVRKHIDSKVMTLTNHFWTMHGTQTAEFKDEQGGKVGDYVLFKPNVINRRWSWRVASTADNSTVLYTIQKRLWNDNCKVDNGIFWWKCKPVLKIFVGHKDDRSSLIYYGVGDRDLEEPDFKFYRTQHTYKDNKKKNWVARIEHKKTKYNGEDRYKIKVKPGEDAALLLLATACLDTIGDSAKEDNEHDYSRDYSHH